MRFGLHIGTSAGIARSFRTAAECGCECIQLFSGNPKSYHDTPLSDKAIAETRAALAANGLTPLVYHTPYLINLATPNDEAREKSIALLLAALRKAGQIGVTMVNTHVGNHMGQGVEAGIERIVSALASVAPAVPDGCAIVLENGPGKGTEIGARVDELTAVIRRADLGDRLGLCLDTAHLWGAGYDLREPSVIDALLAEIDAGVGLATLRLFHGNDNARRLGGLTDLHRHPGEGEIGLAAFADLYGRPQLADLPVIMEMPGDTIEEQARSLATVKGLGVRGQGSGIEDARRARPRSLTPDPWPLTPYASPSPHPPRFQDVRQPDGLRVPWRHHRRHRAERLRQVERGRRGALGAGREEPCRVALETDRGRHLRRQRRPPGDGDGRGQPDARQ